MPFYTSTETFLALLQLLEQAEVSRNFGAHYRGCDAEDGTGV